tara:strand:- start:6293 stop:6586 length:294 start_codon:yes stop_codon:yes gene_type:complete
MWIGATPKDTERRLRFTCATSPGEKAGIGLSRHEVYVKLARSYPSTNIPAASSSPHITQAAAQILALVIVELHSNYCHRHKRRGIRAGYSMPGLINP